MGKKYIADLISVEEYGPWLNGQKVLIHADTGMGKTTFITKIFLTYCRLRGKKMLVLCNRRLLYRQYEATMAEVYRRYEAMETEVTIKTYQELALLVRNGGTLKTVLAEFDVIVADECHFFYADADFNPAGTYVLLQALVLAAYTKTMIFMTATMFEVKPLLIETFASCRRVLEKTPDANNPRFSDYHFHGKIYEFHNAEGYDRFDALILPDVDAICEMIAKSEKKSIVFIDDINKAKELKDKIEKAGGIKAAEIAVFSAEYLESHPRDKIVASLCLANKVIPRVLITTSVLDNGTSIHDFTVGNVVIATDSPISMIQMLGRVRGEQGQKIKLVLFPRSVGYYVNRIEQTFQKLEWIKDIKKRLNPYEELALVKDGWYGNDDFAEFLRNILVLTTWENDFYGWNPPFAYVTRAGGDKVALNQFAMEKIGNAYNEYLRLYQKELARPFGALFEQFSWLGIDEGEVLVQESAYLEEQKKKLIADLLTIDGLDNGEYKDKKKYISETYRKSLLSDILDRGGSFSFEKLSEICSKFGLTLVKEIKFSKTFYTVKKDTKADEKTAEEFMN